MICSYSAVVASSFLRRILANMWGEYDIKTLFWNPPKTILPGSSHSKDPACNAADLGLIPGLGRSPGGGNGNPL